MSITTNLIRTFFPFKFIHYIDSIGSGYGESFINQADKKINNGNTADIVGDGKNGLLDVILHNDGGELDGSGNANGQSRVDLDADEAYSAENLHPGAYTRGMENPDGTYTDPVLNRTWENKKYFDENIAYSNWYKRKTQRPFREFVTGGLYPSAQDEWDKSTKAHTTLGNIRSERDAEEQEESRIAEELEKARKAKKKEKALEGITDAGDDLMTLGKGLMGSHFKYEPIGK